MFSKDQKPLQKDDDTVSNTRASNESIELKPTLEVGDLFAGRFRVLNRLGSGGMGDVFKVEDVGVQRIVALKILQSNFSTGAKSMQRFQQEARAAGSLDHPNIAKVLEFGVADGAQPYLVMEYCPGESLSEHLKSSGCLSEPFAREVVTQISHALELAHAKGVVHRDLKPANVVLVMANDRFTVKVVDFGIAKILSSDDSPGLTKTGEIFGSPLYMSPEQAESGIISGRSDQYSLGCLFYECLTGAPPHIGKTSIETLIKHRTEVPRSLKEASLGSDFSANTQAIVGRLLQKDPGDRYPSMIDVIQAFNGPSPASTKSADSREPRRLVPSSWRRGIFMVLLFAAIAGGSAFIGHKWTETHSIATNNETSAATVVPGAAAVVPSEPTYRTTAPAASTWDNTTTADAIAVNEERSNPQQTKFDMKGQDISNEGLRGFATHNQVTWLNLRENHKVTDDGMKFLKQLPLTTLDLSLTGVTSGALKILPLKQLRSLQLGWTNVDDAGIPALAGAKNLEALILEGTSVEGKTFVNLRVLKKLQTLSLNRTKVTHSVIQRLHALPLHYLYLDYTEISDNDLKSLTDMPLTILSIRGTQVSEKGLQYLRGMKSLKKVYVNEGANFPPKVIARLKNEYRDSFEVL